jgi:hypothetical protein
MKKNPLSEIYESKILTSEAVPSNKVKGASELDAKIDAKKARPVADQGPDAAKKYVDTPKELKDTEVHEPKVLKDSMEHEEPKKAFEGSFEKLFKATINEEMMDEPSTEIDVTVPTSDEEMVDELEGESDEVSDLVSDLQDLMSNLQSILDKVSGETEVKDEVEMEFGGEDELEDEENLEDEEEEPFKEAVELKPLGDKGKVLMGKNNKVGGAPKVHGGKAHGGNIESDPKLKPAKTHDKSLQNPKGKPEVKSTVKKGDFFK